MFRHISSSNSYTDTGSGQRARSDSNHLGGWYDRRRPRPGHPARALGGTPALVHAHAAHSTPAHVVPRRSCGRHRRAPDLGGISDEQVRSAVPAARLRERHPHARRCLPGRTRKCSARACGEHSGPAVVLRSAPCPACYCAVVARHGQRYGVREHWLLTARAGPVRCVARRHSVLGCLREADLDEMR